ncbi:MAG: hypothetical protein OXI95_04365 [bacterium]|nr:hypothetical protein [bacterium]
MTSDDSGEPAKDSTTHAPWTRGPALAAKRTLARHAGWLASGILVLVLAALVAGLAWLWSGTRDTTARLVDLEERVFHLTAETGETDLDPAVTHLAERLDALEAALAAEGEFRAGLEADLAELVQRIELFEEDLNDAPPPVDPGSDTERPDVADRERARLIDMLRREVATLREMLDTLAARSGDHVAAFVVAVGQLREAVDSGRPFVAEHEAVAALEANDPGIKADLDILARHAGIGIPTHRALEESLAHALAAASSALKVAAASGWVDETLAHIESLVTVRRIDGEELSGTGSLATIRRIEAAVATGDLEEALREIDSLPVQTAGTLAQWAGQARSRVEADGVLDRLHARAISGVTQP